jgi:Mu-like prophage FluMu N-terminal domain
MEHAMTKKILTITASREGFRRAGHAFGREPVQLPEDDLTGEQIAMLKAEPMLTVIESESEADGEIQDTDPINDRGANIDNPDADDEQPNEQAETKPARKSKK